MLNPRRKFHSFFVCQASALIQCLWHSFNNNPPKGGEVDGGFDGGPPDLPQPDAQEKLALPHGPPPRGAPDGVLRGWPGERARARVDGWQE